MSEKPMFSVSRIQTYLTCPYKYYVEYVLKETSLMERSHYLQLGLSFSDIVKTIYQDPVSYANITENMIIELCDKFWIPEQWKERYNSLQSYNSTFPTWEFIGYRSLEHELENKKLLVIWVQKYVESVPIRNYLGIEMSLNYETDMYRFYGILDFLDYKRSIGGILIDNKLGNTVYPLETNLQLVMYTVALERSYNLHIGEVGIRYVKTNTLKTIPRKSLQVESVLASTESTIAEILQTTEFKKVENYSCRYCKKCNNII